MYQIISKNENVCPLLSLKKRKGNAICIRHFEWKDTSLSILFLFFQEQQSDKNRAHESVLHVDRLKIISFME